MLRISLCPQGVGNPASSLKGRSRISLLEERGIHAVISRFQIAVGETLYKAQPRSGGVGKGRRGRAWWLVLGGWAISLPEVASGGRMPLG